MSQSEKAAYYRALKQAGVRFEKHYREYSTEELKAAHDRLVELEPQRAVDAGLINPPPSAAPDPKPQPEPVFDSAATAAAFAALGQPPADEPPAQQPFLSSERQQLADEPRVPQAPPVAARNPREMPGERLNSKPADEPIRVDENGLVWYQEEVRKPAYPKPRGRRVLKYMETGTRTERVKAGDYIEEFEVAGDQPSRPAEVKITLPSYQVGIYKDPRFPFKIHVYNENRGFNLFEVQNYYGGSELVPTEIKRVYVENVLCYDIRTTIRAIQAEYRQLQLTGKVK